MQPPLTLYFAPLACSMASRIALYEAGIDAAFRQVVLSNKTLVDGGDYWAINPKGQVPALALGDGRILTESPVLLQAIADMAPASGLAPPPADPARLDLQMWLNMIATEIHSGAFVPQMHPAAGPEARAFALVRLEPRFNLLDAHLAGRDYLMDRFTVADAYLVTALGWTDPVGIDLARWPALAAYRARLRTRPSVARALAEEQALRA
jgi:glutathione S-transferase